MGNDLETNEILYFALFCSNQKNAFPECKGNEYFFNYQNNNWKTRKNKRTFQSLKDSMSISMPISRV